MIYMNSSHDLFITTGASVCPNDY